jgi:CxxC motif-containing protein (DUF1111 family)
MQGLPIIVPVAVAVETVADGEPDEFKFVLRIGRFGWKAQEASLLNFSANAYLNEMGITSPLQPNENKSNGRDVSQFDEVADPEDEAQPKPNLSTSKPTKPDDFLHPFGEDVEAFARFMRSTKVPPRDFALTELDIFKDIAKAGEEIFSDIKCAVCHTPQYITPPAGTAIIPIWGRNNSTPGVDFGSNDKKGVVPEALGNKILRPFSDFMLHDIGPAMALCRHKMPNTPPAVLSGFYSKPSKLQKFNGSNKRLPKRTAASCTWCKTFRLSLRAPRRKI